MSLSTMRANAVDSGNSLADVAVHGRGNHGDTYHMTILPDLISISIRKYETQPNDRGTAVRMLLRNAIRLAISHLGKEQAETLALQTFQEPAR